MKVCLVIPKDFSAEESASSFKQQVPRLENDSQANRSTALGMTVISDFRQRGPIRDGSKPVLILAHHFSITFQNFFNRTVPRELLHLLIAGLAQFFAQRLVEQHPLQGAHHLKKILRIHQHRSISHYFRDRGRVRGQHRGAVRHGLKRRQPESFVKRREDEHLGGIIKNSQHFDGDESQKANIVLHAASDHRTPQVRMLRQFVSNDNELQVGIDVLLGEFGFQRGKRLDDAHQVLVWADAASVEQEWVRYLITFREHLPVSVGGMSGQKSRVNRVVYDLDAAGLDAKQFLKFALGEL